MVVAAARINTRKISRFATKYGANYAGRTGVSGEKHGKNAGQIKFYDKNGFVQSTDIDWTKGYFNYSERSEEDDNVIHQSTFF